MDVMTMSGLCGTIISESGAGDSLGNVVVQLPSVRGKDCDYLASYNWSPERNDTNTQDFTIQY
jgi:hypothetical protein